MQISLAPMEGLADYALRKILTELGDYDFAVSEFIRVTNSTLPVKTFYRMCEELKHGSKTCAGTPVIVQLLGSDAAQLAKNAARLATLSPRGIDLNFGCPAKTVNRHGGGAMLLANPEHIHHIVQRVRYAMPAHVPLSAKMRLGISDTSNAIECAWAIEEGGAESLVVHARTRDEGYQPPAHWAWVARIQSELSIPVTVNGEIWTLQDCQRALFESGVPRVMLGRGAVADPFLSLRIRGLAPDRPTSKEWKYLKSIVQAYWQSSQAQTHPKYASGRLKRWLNLLRRTWVEADRLFEALRLLTDYDQVAQALAHTK